MKTLFLAFLVSFSASAVELKFIGPCSDEFIMKTEVSGEFANVGELTVATLSKWNVPFKGDASGLASVFEIGNLMENVSATEIRAYGWCYSVDGEAPEAYPNEVLITPDTKSIVWHYGYALFKDGQWITQCTPAYNVKPASLCTDPVTGSPE